VRAWALLLFSVLLCADEYVLQTWAKLVKPSSVGREECKSTAPQQSLNKYGTLFAASKSAENPEQCRAIGEFRSGIAFRGCAADFSALLVFSHASAQFLGANQSRGVNGLVLFSCFNSVRGCFS